jgi:predicted DNA-binding WGR domain protein
MAQFYVMVNESSLLGEVGPIRKFGRIGTAGQCKIELYETEGRAT